MTPLPTTTPYDRDDYPPLSALNDLLFCPRRCYLHRVEGLWLDNVHTVHGTQGHRRVHTERDADEGPMRTARGLWLVSHRLRLCGIADVVEFHPAPRAHGDSDVEPRGPDVPFPIEYKRGKRRRWDNDDVQLCAQAMALEEMLGVAVPAGAVFHASSRRRREVPFDARLRGRTLQAAAQLHALLASSSAPLPVVRPRCAGCSLQSLCMPELISSPSAYARAAESLFRP
jgi:CRISPR-associated exonuclease Cas4